MQGSGAALFSEDGAVGSGRLTRVSMVQTSQQRQRDDVASFRWLSGARMGAVLVQRPMCAVAVEIVKIIPQDPTQVLSVAYDHMIQTLAPDGTDHSFDKGILPG